MVVDSIDELESEAVVSRRGQAIALILAVLIGIALGLAGWMLPSYGGSLVVPTAIVFGMGAALSLGGGVLASFRPRRFGDLWLFTFAVAVFTLLASFWTFAFALPASLEWDSTATHQAQLTLAHLAQKAKDGVVVVPCVVVGDGSVGTLQAPYQECAIYTPEGHFLNYTSPATPDQGLAYTDRGAATFLVSCSRQLVGKWWMFAPSDGGLGGCPFGYQYHGGP